MPDKRCTDCREVKDLNEFSRHATTRDGRKGRCKACAAKRQREAAAMKRAADPLWERRKSAYYRKR